MGHYIIVGGNSGIGLATGKLLLADGHTLGQWSRTEGALSALGVDWQEYKVGEESKLVLPERIDGLVYCQGTVRLKPFHRISRQEFIEDFEVNALGAASVVQHALKALRANGGSIVFFSSVAAQTGLGFHASIAMAKAAVEGLSVSLAAELAPKIRVNTIAPSLTDTPLVAGLLKTEAHKDASAQRHPLKCIGKAEGVAKMVCYLLSDDSQFITGQVFKIDGGLSSVRV